MWVYHRVYNSQSESRYGLFKRVLSKSSSNNVFAIVDVMNWIIEIRTDILQLYHSPELTYLPQRKYFKIIKKL